MYAVCMVQVFVCMVQVHTHKYLPHTYIYLLIPGQTLKFVVH